VNKPNQENDKNIFLATTALEDFWDTTKPIVFLGDWCLRYSRRNFWQPLNGEVLPSIWKDKKIFIDAYVYLQDVYERLLQQMAALLDEVHGEKHDIRYWRIIIGPWLFHYIDVLYDRHLSIQTAKTKYPFFDTIILSEDSFITPLSTSESILLSTDDPYNLQIYSRILSLEKNNFRQKYSDVIARKAQPIRKKNLLGVIKKKFITTCSRSIALVKTGESVYLVDPYFSKSSIIKIFLKSKGKIKPIFPTNEEMPIATPNNNMRSCFGGILLNNNEFENLIIQLLPYDIPHSFLESYKMMKKESLNYPSEPKAIMSWVSWYFDEKFKIWAATAAEAGCSLYGVQYGGDYGINQYMQVLDHEVAITDRFYSWGWNDSALKVRIVPMTVSIAIGKKKFENNNKNTKILFAGTAASRYFYRLHYPTTNHLEKYFDDQVRFFKSAGLSYQKFISYRAFTQDYGFDIVKRIQNACPDLIMEGWDIPFQESLMNCKLFVCDHLSTVHAEALSLNAPTILFWDPESYIQRTEARRYLENLHAVGILHYSPESAAKMVNQVYDNVDDWWNEQERQSARLEFCDHFAKNSPNAIDEWTNEFRKISR
jgi:putative transferase (TIGR04331 family)